MKQPQVVLHVCGLGESDLAQRLAGLPLGAHVRLSYKASLPYNSVILYGEAEYPGELESATRQARARLADDVFGEDEQTLPGVVGELLRARGQRLAVAESCTGGGLGALITEVPGCSAWFMGGLITYANSAKIELLDVDTALIERHGAVSEPCAEAMARGARRKLGADYALSITGVAGPGGGTRDKPVGTVCLGLVSPGGQRSKTLRLGNRGRGAVRQLSSALALEWLRRRVLQES